MGTLRILALLALLPSFVVAETFNTDSDPTAAEINALIASMSDGDTLIVADGTHDMTDDIIIDKAIVFQGGGIDVTILQDSAEDSGASQMFNVDLVANKTTRITGFSVTNGGRSSYLFGPNGIFEIDGTSSTSDNDRLVFDNVKMTNPQGEFIRTRNVFGVIHSCQFTPSGNQRAVIVYNTNWDGGGYGDGSWADSPYLGSDKFLFFEDNDIDRTGKSVYGSIDAFSGARYVARYNTLKRSSFQTHGTESGQRDRGTAVFEIYENTYDNDGSSGAIANIRSGTGVVYNNIASDGSFSLTLNSSRIHASFSPWGAADGTSEWDVNVAGGPFDSGTATAGSGDKLLEDTSKSWTPDEWIGYMLKRTTSGAGFEHAQIVDNDATTLTLDDASGFSPGDMIVASGQTYEIHKVDHVLDQPGRNGGSLISGDTPTPPVGWNDQVTVPIFGWGNTDNGSAQEFSSSGDRNIRINEHYYNSSSEADAEANGLAGGNYVAYTYPHPLRASGGAAYGGRLRFNGTGAKPVRTDGTGQPIIFDR